MYCPNTLRQLALFYWVCNIHNISSSIIIFQLWKTLFSAWYSLTFWISKGYEYYKYPIRDISVLTNLGINHVYRWAVNRTVVNFDWNMVRAVNWMTEKWLQKPIVASHFHFLSYLSKKAKYRLVLTQPLAVSQSVHQWFISYMSYITCSDICLTVGMQLALLLYQHVKKSLLSPRMRVLYCANQRISNLQCIYVYIWSILERERCWKGSFNTV